MLLGDSSAIYIGNTSIDAVYIGSDLVWSSSPTTMPHLDGVLCYYDCNDGIGTEGGNPAWVNRISGGSNMALHNASVAQDGAISFYGGGDSGNGKFSCNTTESATMYVFFKRTGLSVINNYLHICGSVANGEHFPYVGNDGSYWKLGVQFMLNKNAWQESGGVNGDTTFDITNRSIKSSIGNTEYHVVCCIRQKNGAVYDNIMYVDGSLIGRIDGTPYPPGTNYGVCIGVDSFGYEDKTHDGYDTLIKMIAVSNQAHTAQQVTENSLWLLNHFNIYTPLEYIQSTNCQTINTGYIPNENSRIEAEFMLFSNYSNFNQALFGCGRSPNGSSIYFNYNSNGALRTDYCFGSASISSASSVLPYRKRFKLVCDASGAVWYDMNGMQIDSVTIPDGTLSSNNSIYIGSNRNSGAFYNFGEMRIYSFKIYEDNALIMNLVPMKRKSDSVCGMLDLLTNRFYEDANGQGFYSDAFDDNYTRLDSVDTKGNLYVDMEFVHTTGTRMVIDSIPNTADQSVTAQDSCLFGSNYNHSFGSDTWTVWTRTLIPGGVPAFRRGSDISKFCDLSDMDFSRRSIITAEGLKFTMKYQDGTVIEKTHTNGETGNGVNTMYLFHQNTLPNTSLSYQKSYTRFYSCKISEVMDDVETMIRDYIPVKRKFDNIIVLYDTISNSEYPPVGGAFTGWSSNIFDALTFSGGWLDTNGVVQHQGLENYGTSDFFECGNNTKVRVSFTPQYSGERGVMVCAYDENQTFISSPIYASMQPPYTLEEKEFIGDIPSGTKYLRYSYLWGSYNPSVTGDLNTVIQLGS